MTLEQLREICLSFPHATEDIKWGSDLCFCVGEKMFLVTSLDQKPTSVTFKTTPGEFDLLIEKEGIIAAPYVGRNKWVQVDDVNRFSRKEWSQFARNSYELIVSKLPAKFRKPLK